MEEKEIREQYLKLFPFASEEDLNIYVLGWYAGATYALDKEAKKVQSIIDRTQEKNKDDLATISS